MRLCLNKLYKMFSYFSVWADIQLLITSVMPHHRKIHEIHPTLLSLCIASTGGLYITYARPQSIYVEYLDHTFEGIPLKMMDFLGHHLLLIYFVMVEMRPFSRIIQLRPLFAPSTLLLPFLYAVSEIPYLHMYGLDLSDLMIIIPCAFVLYVTLLKNCHVIHSICSALGF